MPRSRDTTRRITDNYGRRSPAFERIKGNLRAARKPCYICGQPIDYTLRAPHPGSFTVEHINPRSTHPHLAEDPANCAAAHWGCNSSKGNGPPKPHLGSTSREW
jgi:5-methylcytosine-specific restriction endonuclease McrA